MRSFYRLTAGFCLLIALLFQPPKTCASTVSPQERTLILISLDGFRWDYLQRFHPANLSRLAQNGVHAKRLISAFPSLTFPNHYTIVTGLWPEHHGIIGNSFYDPMFQTNFAIFNNPGPEEGRWWGGEPIWVTAIKQGRVADCMFWPGSGAAIQGIRPTEWKPFDKKVGPAERVDTVLGWLDKPARPSLVTLYFHEPDTASHHYGTESAELTNAVAQVDEAIGRLLAGLHARKLDDFANLIIVSDHGMTDLSTNRIVALSELTDLDKVRVDFSGAIAGLRPNDTNETAAIFKSIKAKENHFKAYLKENTPKRFHFSEGARIPAIILVADEGWYLRKTPLTAKGAADFEKATHGYDPELKSMGATFIASGPAFKRGVTLGPVENVDIYNLLCATLGLTPAPNDGDDSLVKKVLAK